MSLAVASRYSRALAEVVLGPQSTLSPEQILGEMKAMVDAVASAPDLASVLRSPAVSHHQKRSIIGKLCDLSGCSQIARNLFFVVSDHQRMPILKDIYTTFGELVDKRRGIARANISLASEIAAEQKAKLEGALAHLTGKQVIASYSIDPGLIGGAMARIGSTIYDGSVRGQLASLRRKLVQA